jgi:hypothetical protein
LDTTKPCLFKIANFSSAWVP